MSVIDEPLNESTIARRHETDVRAILTEMRSDQRLIDNVIDIAYAVTLRRGETTMEAQNDFRDWSGRVIRAAREGTALATSGWSDHLTVVLNHYLDIAATPGMTAAQATHLLVGNDTAALSNAERHVAELVKATLLGSLHMWTEPTGTATDAAKKKDGIDGSQVVRADVMGAITGAAGAAVSTWWTGPLSGGAVAGAATTGAVLGSAVDAVLQDAETDAVDDADPTP